MANPARDALSELLGSRARAEIFRYLFGSPAREAHLRQLQRETKLAIRTVAVEVNRLVRLGLLRKRRSGSQQYLSADTNHPAYKALVELVAVTAGIRTELAEALRTDPRIQRAWLFGSVAKGLETTESDVDLLVVGELDLRQLLALLRPVQERIKRPINPVLMEPAEFEERRARREHFLTRVLQSNPITLVGSFDDASDMVRKRLPQTP